MSIPGAGFNDISPDGVPFGTTVDQAISWDFTNGASDSTNINGTTPDDVNEPLPGAWGNTYSFSGKQYKPQADPPGAAGYELLGLGLFEALPPPEMIEEL